MAERFQPLILPLGNVGWATDLPVQTRQLTHYTAAENVMYELSGAVRKVGGNLRVNSTTITDSPSVMGMFDYWRAGVSGTWTQKFVVVTDNSMIYKEDMDGTFDDITGGATIAANAIPVFCVARDTLLIFFSTNNTPLKWNQTGNAATLGGSPPAGRGAVWHLNRVWTWGENANPSRLTYGSSTSFEDFTGVDTGAFDIDVDDGDRIIGAVPYKKKLIVFKGPNFGSIHVIGGTAPTGADAFRRDIMTRGIALQTHNSIIQVLDDIWFMSDRGIHSLKSTDQYGDFEGAFLTRFHNGYFRETAVRTRLNQVWGSDYKLRGCAVWVMPVSGSTTNNIVFGLSYIRLQEDGLKAFSWTRSGASITTRINPSTYVKEIVTGSENGYVLREDQTTRRLATNGAYTMTLTTPWILLGENDAAGQVKPYNPASLQRANLRSISVGDWDVTLSVATDIGDSAQYGFNQGANFAGAKFDQVVFDEAKFSSDYGPQFAFNDLAGEGRTAQFTLSQGGLDQDAHLLEMVIEKTPSAWSDEVI